MPEEKQNINAAHRLHSVLSQAVANAPNSTQLQVWTNVFGLQGLSGRKQKLAVFQGIKLLYDELDDIVAYLKESNHPASSYRHVVNLIEQNVLVEGINQVWQDFRVRIEPALPLLLMLSNFLPDQENPISEEEFRALQSELSKLQQSLEEKEISPVICSYVKRQINIIQNALWEYKFRGVQVFYEARIKAVVLESDPEVIQHRDDPPVKSVRHIWKKIGTIMDATIKIKGTLMAGKTILELGEKVFHYFNN